MSFNDEILRYSLHEVNSLEQLTIKALKEPVPFKFIAYLIEKNINSLAKLCVDLPIEESSLKHFATLILNLSKIKHLHLTANTKLDTYYTSPNLMSLKHLLTKDSLTTIIIDRFPLLSDFTTIGGLPNSLETLVFTGVVPQAKQTKKDYCTFIY